GLEVLGEHRRDDLVIWSPTNRRGVFGPPEDRVGAEEGRGEEPGHDGSESYSSYSIIAIY
ncbi:MAG: hypothetical protein OXF79_28490, partial [Chloroflexi bacterium]|nr:hypothetical protein [Chloroflexota bacterium]